MAATAMTPRVRIRSKFISSPSEVCRDELIMRTDNGKSIKMLVVMNYFFPKCDAGGYGRGRDECTVGADLRVCPSGMGGCVDFQDHAGRSA